jgi:uncharacterized protein (TIGR03086 family)
LSDDEEEIDMDSALYGRALERTREVVAGIRPDQLEDPSPCADWNVHAVLNHLIGMNLAFAAGAKGEVEETSEDIDRVEGDHLAAYDRAAQAALEASKKEGISDKTFTMPWGDTPGSMALTLVIADTAVHGWDLAQGTGQKMPIDDDIAEAVYGATSGMLQPKGNFPRGDSFADPVEVDDDAPASDRMLAYLGRRP